MLDMLPGLDRVSESIPLHEVDRITKLHEEHSKADKVAAKSASMRDLASSTPLQISDSDTSEYSFRIHPDD